MIAPCTSCGLSPCAPHCAWAIVAPPKSIVRAAIDPGSRWIAVVITRDDGPASPCTFLDALPIEVGRWVPFAPGHPKYRKPKIVDEVAIYTPLGAHVATQDDRDAAADAVAAFLIRWRVEAVDVEHVERVFAKTPQAASKASEYLLAARETYTRALTLWGVDRASRGLPSPRVLMLATSWRARLNALVKASAKAAGLPVGGVMIHGRGLALEPVLVDHVPGWPGGATWGKDEVEHIRDACGLALACGLPVLPKRVVRAGEPRARRPRVGGKRGPRGSRSRAKMATVNPERLARYRATDRLRERRARAAARPAAVAARAALGCACATSGPALRGHHGAVCLQGEAMALFRAAVCSCREEPSREGRHRASCAIRVLLARAGRAPCSCPPVTRLGKRHRAGCPLHKPRATATRLAG